MKSVKTLYLAIFLFILGVIFKNWFLGEAIIGGDWPYYYRETLQEFTFFPVTWNPEFNNGLGGVDSVYFLNTFQNFTVLLSQMFHIPWVVIYKIFWFGLFIALSVIATITLLKITIPNARYWQLLTGATIFVSNTYILMVVGGGQMGVALSYSLAPLVLATFLKQIHESNSLGAQIKNSREAGSRSARQISNFKLSLIAGLVLASQVMFDPRIAYITMIATGLYFIFNFLIKPTQGIKFLYSLLLTFVLPIIIVLLIHASWVLPLFLFRHNPIGDLGEAYTGSGIVQFLSFAHFSDALALLHPNWPDNLFGKTYFMRPEFILIPIVAFASLLFLNFAERRRILFFILIGLLGAFLSKGANEPFGEIYIWLFDHVPGFVFFRDPTKFYVLIALAYSILIPWTLGVVKKNKIFRISYVFLLFTFLYLLFLIRPAILGQLGGTFLMREAPKEYLQLKDNLHNQPEFFRTLWIPRRDRFSYYSNNHLAIESEPLFGIRNLSELSKILNSNRGKNHILALGVKYIIIPLDPYGEVFVKDRKYDPKEHKKTIMLLETIPWLTKLPNFGKIAVFETDRAKDRFSLTKDGSISIKTISPTEYVVNVSVGKPQELIFSESYNPSWEAKSNTHIFISKKTEFGLNSFALDKKGNYDLTVSFTQDKYYKYGQIISVATLIVTIVLVALLRKKDKINR